MKILITGAQGSGKTECINRLKNLIIRSGGLAQTIKFASSIRVLRIAQEIRSEGIRTALIIDEVPTLEEAKLIVSLKSVKNIPIIIACQETVSQTESFRHFDQIIRL